MKISTTLAGVLILCLFAVAQQDLPVGWREPTTSELGKMGSSRTLVAADLDGDGKEDRAVVVVDTSSKMVGVFAFASSVQQWFKLHVEPVSVLRHPDYPIRLYIAQPGTYYAADRKRADIRSRLRLQQPAVGLNISDTSDEVFYWNVSRKGFAKALVISD